MLYDIMLICRYAMCRYAECRGADVCAANVNKKCFLTLTIMLIEQFLMVVLKSHFLQN